MRKMKSPLQYLKHIILFVLLTYDKRHTKLSSNNKTISYNEIKCP